MSTCEELEALGAGGLISLESFVCGDDTMRCIYATASVASALSPPYPDGAEGEMHDDFKATMDAFLEGAEFTLSENPYDKPPDTMIARVDPVAAEVWDIRSIAPHPGIRCLGLFFKQDVFVALMWDYRENFNGQWEKRVIDCQQLWSTYFGSRPPVSGSSPAAYLTRFLAV